MDMSNLDEQTRRFFTRKTFHGEFRVEGLQVEVAVDTPELLDAAVRMWGDWGPMYSCTLKPEHRVVAVYRCADTGQQSSFRFRPQVVRLLSPPRYETRGRWPLYLEFVDPDRGLCFRAFMNPEGRVEETEVFALHPRLSVLGRLFGDTSSDQGQMVAK